MTRSQQPEILIVTTKADLTADYVVMALEDRGADFYRLNTEDLPEAATSCFEALHNGPESIRWTWASGTQQVDLSRLRAIWYRRHRLPILNAELSEGRQDFCLRECDWFLRGALLSRNVQWMSYPPAVAAAEAKLFQLAVSREVGFSVPNTIVTNDITKAREFCRAHGRRMIAKAIRVGFIDDGALGSGIFSNLITLEDLNEEDENLKLAPVIFQELIEKVYDLRITIVANRIFAARIDSQSVESARIDWRRSESNDLPHSSVTLPESVIRCCFALLRKLGLRFGAIDMAVDHIGQYHFLEINPSGQWAWLQDRLGFDIAGAIAEWLVTPTCNREA